ncbi:MAG: FAD-dependent oxidoreductase [Patescibacteria group bacterium]|jgi:alkyl hydroperoxide reductase subunit F|nr:FAD-dependent oxidoreductase [Patescibacteria group bacterium]
MYDIVIIGGGPAAISSGIYASRKKLNTLLITESFGGQSIVSDSIENWIGEENIGGFDLAQKLEKHLRAQEGIEINIGEKVEKVLEEGETFIVKTNKGEYKTKTVMVTSGGRRRKMGVPGEEKFNGKGVVFCSTCDAPLFRGKEAAVVGGGNSGIEAVIDLLPYATKITLINNTDILKGDPQTVSEIEGNEKVEIIHNAQVKEIKGEVLVEALVYLNKDGVEEILNLQGVFVEIGSVPNSEMVADLVELNDYKEIVSDHRTYETSKKGIYAAGDVTDEIYKQNNIAAGDAITATLSAYNYLLNFDKKSPAHDTE